MSQVTYPLRPKSANTLKSEGGQLNIEDTIVSKKHRAASAETYSNKQQSNKKKHYVDKKEVDMSIVGESTTKQQNINKKHVISSVITSKETPSTINTSDVQISGGRIRPKKKKTVKDLIEASEVRGNSNSSSDPIPISKHNIHYSPPSVKIPSESDLKRINDKKNDNSFITPDLSVCSSNSNTNSYTTPTSPIITPKIPIKSISYAPKTPSQPNNLKRPNIQSHNTPSPPLQQQQQYIKQSPPHHYSPPQKNSNHSSGKTSPIYSPKHRVSSYKKNEDGVTILADNSFSPLSQSGGLSLSLLSDSFENDPFGSSDNGEKNFYYVSPCRSLDSSTSSFSQQ